MKITKINELEAGGAELTVEMDTEEHDEIFEFGFNEALRGGLEIIEETEGDYSDNTLEELLNMVEGDFYLSFTWEKKLWELRNRKGLSFYGEYPIYAVLDALDWQKKRDYEDYHGRF